MNLHGLSKFWVAAIFAAALLVMGGGMTAFAKDKSQRGEGRDSGRRYDDDDDRHKSKRFDSSRHQQRERDALRRHQRREIFFDGNSSVLRRHQSRERARLWRHQDDENDGWRDDRRRDRYDRDDDDDDSRGRDRSRRRR